MRGAGILLPVFSLPSPYGIGTMGRAAYGWIDFLYESWQSYWQVLPLGPTGYGDSPYQSFSAFAGNPYLIDLQQLCDENLLTRQECEALDWGKHPTRIDYQALYQGRYPLLQKAFQRFSPDPSFDRFCTENAYWLEDYVLYTAIKQSQQQRSWNRWPEPLRRRDDAALQKAREQLQNQMAFHRFVQYLFFRQWNALHAYAKKKKINIIGDIPIYVAMDSADTWAHQQLFRLDDAGAPIDVAGCPPDAFSPQGQLWGNPLYRWDRMEQQQYRWWLARIEANLSLYDLLRLDHFRGFESYYAIAAGETTAAFGKWCKAPGMNFLSVVNNTFGAKRFIAEDLGFLTPEVENLLRESGYPGMKVLQFAFDAREPSGNGYLPYRYLPNCIVYTGTHDNDTVLGWMQSANPDDVALAKEYFHIIEGSQSVWEWIRGAFSSVADTAIIPMQDYLQLGSSARINTPSTLGGLNWCWRMENGSCTASLAQKIASLTQCYGRTPSP